MMEEILAVEEEHADESGRSPAGDGLSGAAKFTWPSAILTEPPLLRGVRRYAVREYLRVGDGVVSGR
jgi:hypothetical protein